MPSVCRRFAARPRRAPTWRPPTRLTNRSHPPGPLPQLAPTPLPRQPAARTHNRSPSLGSVRAGVGLGSCSLRLTPHLGLQTAITSRDVSTYQYGFSESASASIRMPASRRSSEPPLPFRRFDFGFLASGFLASGILASGILASGTYVRLDQLAIPYREVLAIQTARGPLHDLAGKLQRFAHTGCETAC